MRLLIFALSLLAWTVQGAITEKYVTSAGAGTHDGSSEGNAFSWTEMVTDINAGGKAGNRYNVKGSISRTSSSDNVTGSGTTNSPIIIRGYSSTIGDGYLGRSNGNGPLITSNMPSLSYTSGLFNISGSYIIFESINFSSTRSGSGWYFSGGGYCDVVRCVASQAGSGSGSIALYASSTHMILLDNDISLTNGGAVGTEALYVSGNTARIIGCRITSVTNAVVAASTVVTIAICNTIYSSSGVAITTADTTSPNIFWGNTIASGATNAIQFAAARTVPALVVNNCITDNTGFGIQFGDANAPCLFANNRTRDNVAGDASFSPDWWTATNYSPVTTDTGGPEQDYVSAGTGDYRLISTSPAVGNGLPKYASMGALEPQATSSATVSHSFPIFQ